MAAALSTTDTMTLTDARAAAFATSEIACNDTSVSFQETLSATLRRWLLGFAYAVMPARISGVPHLIWNMALDIARGGTRIPDQARTSKPDTFGGVCRDISPASILAAARLGFFPWCHIGPLKWWTREKRMVVFFNEYHIAKTLRRDMRKKGYRVTFDEAFDQVIVACSGRRSYNSHALTWITPEIMQLYSALHRQGHAHSFEVWSPDGRLVGGGYGVSAGRTFMTESLFSHEPNTSKMGFAVLNYHLAKWGYALNDGKDFSPTLASLGFRLIPRAEHEAILENNTEVGSSGGKIGPWQVEDDIATVAGWNPAAPQAVS